MKRNPIIWLSGAGILFATMQDNFDLLLLSILAGMAATLFPALKNAWLSRRAEKRDEPRIRQLEERLSLTEDELAFATRELAELKEQHEFELQLHRSKLNPQDAASAKR
ncbi:MAG: hypothetical protein ACT4O1_06115 [Gemmatimonadota bacterium]